VPAKVFLDTSHWVALVTETDQFHEKAIEISQRIANSSSHLVTTQAVLLELGNSLAKKRYRQDAGQLLRFLSTDPAIDVVPLTSELFNRGLQLFETRKDKEWGLVDCISFTVMTDRGVTEALTSDEHFEQAGFVALLRQ
jgi:predicted nucleic acid-binding protein